MPAKSIAEARQAKIEQTKREQANPNAIIKNNPGRPTEYTEKRVGLNFRISEELKDRLDKYCREEKNGIAKVKVYCDILEEFLQSKGY